MLSPSLNKDFTYLLTYLLIYLLTYLLTIQLWHYINNKIVISYFYLLISVNSLCTEFESEIITFFSFLFKIKVEISLLY